jgi:NADPH:quinone reductase-like Zn-dependent oxidoreductase
MQIAKWKGGRTIGVARMPISAEHQREYGIDHTLVADANNGHESLTDGVLRLTEGKGANVAYDCVGGPLFEPCLRTLGRLGRQANITSVGDRRVSFDLVDFYHRRLSLFGVDSRAYDTEASSVILERLTPGFESGALQAAPVAKRFSLGEAQQAYTQVNDGTIGGKAVFTF